VLLHGAKLDGAKLCRANLGVRSSDQSYQTDLSETSLEGADLSFADLSGVKLCKANLRNADLTQTNLKNANLQGAIMPDGSIHE
jgi:uncharacterized protein YjbI with pentapeptide repeats